METLTSRLTRKNPSMKSTYRIPFVTDVMFREDHFMDERVILGVVADRLGAYEDLGTVEELEQMKDELKRMKKQSENIRVHPNKSE